MFCKCCNRVTVCKAIDPKLVVASVQSGRRFYRTSHEDIQYFRRGRICLACETAFLTAELREDFLSELTELREALGRIKQNAEKYVSEATSASGALAELTNSLEVLRALKIYKAQK
jgi:hypothetical protein